MVKPNYPLRLGPLALPLDYVKGCSETPSRGLSMPPRLHRVGINSMRRGRSLCGGPSATAFVHRFPFISCLICFRRLALAKSQTFTIRLWGNVASRKNLHPKADRETPWLSPLLPPSPKFLRRLGRAVVTLSLLSSALEALPDGSQPYCRPSHPFFRAEVGVKSHPEPGRNTDLSLVQ
jgi:hypothetical protein